MEQGVLEFFCEMSKKVIFSNVFPGSPYGIWSASEGHQDFIKAHLLALASTTEHKTPRSYEPFTFFFDLPTILTFFRSHVSDNVFQVELRWDKKISLKIYYYLWIPFWFSSMIWWRKSISKSGTPRRANGVPPGWVISVYMMRVLLVSHQENELNQTL